MTIINSITGGGTGNIAAVEADAVTVYPGTTVADRPIEASSYGLDGMSKAIVRGIFGLNWRTHPVTGSKYLTYPRSYDIPGGGFDSSWEYNWRNAANEMSADDMTDPYYNSYGVNTVTNRAYSDKLPVEAVFYEGDTGSWNFKYTYSDVEQPVGEADESTLVFNSWFTSRNETLFVQTRDVCTIWKMPADRDMGRIASGTFSASTTPYWSASDPSGITKKIELKVPANNLKTPQSRGGFNTEYFTDIFHSVRTVYRGIYMNLYDSSDVFIGCVSDRIHKYTTSESFNAWNRGQPSVRFDPENNWLYIQASPSDFRFPRTMNGRVVSKVQCIMDLQVLYCSNSVTYTETLG